MKLATNSRLLRRAETYGQTTSLAGHASHRFTNSYAQEASQRNLRTREHLTEAEVERLMEATKRNRYGQRDATMILVAYRHGLRASELTDCTFDDVGSLDDAVKSTILDKDSYASSQPFGAERRTNDSDGLAYPSVRHDGGQCIAAFWPNVIGIPVQERHLRYEWDGTKVSRYFDFNEGTWNAL
jgi:site-specific recombinase XerC